VTSPELRSQRAPAPVIVPGVAMIIVGLTFPWVGATSRSSERMIRPLTEDVLSAPSILVVVLLLTATVVTLTSGEVGFLGCIAAIAFNASASIWLFGAAVLAWLPSSMLPDNPIVSLEIGVSLVLTGSLLVLLGCFSALFDATWGRQTAQRVNWWFVASIGVALAAVVGRGAPVLSATAQGFEWTVSAEQVPGLGDVQGALALGVAVLVIAVALFRRKKLCLALLAVSVMYAVSSLFLVGVSGLLERAGDAAADRIGYGDAEFVTVYDAPLLSVPASLAAMLIALFGLRRHTRPTSTATPVERAAEQIEVFRPSPTATPETRPPLPF